MNFEKALSELITYGTKIEDAYMVIASNQQNLQLPLRITKQHLQHVLALYIGQEITDDDLSLWATVVDNQSAIDTSDIEGFLFALVNSEQMGEISAFSIERMLSLLKP